MFLDEAFTLPTGSGFPLKFSLAGIFAPGATGHLKIDREMVTFSPETVSQSKTELNLKAKSLYT